MERNQLTPLPLMLTVRLGIRHLPIKVLTRMKPGDMLTLEQALNQPLDLLVGDKLIGKCEVISLKDKLGIRIVELYEFPVASGCGRRKPQ